MGKVLRLGLVLVGAFLLVLGLLFQFYVGDRLQTTPLDVDSTTRLSGEAQLAGADGDVEAIPVKAISITRSDSAESTDDVVVFENSSCVVRDLPDTPDCVSADDPEKRLLTASTSNFATDRKTALAVNDPDLLPAEVQPRSGLVNKFPFASEKKDYPYWDSTVGDSVDAQYIGEEDIDGLQTYKYQVTVDDFATEVTSGVQGTYNTEKTIWVEPITGAIVRQTENQSRYTEDGELFLTLALDFTDEQIETSVDDAKSDSRRLGLATGWLPIAAIVLGLLMVGAGAVLHLRGRRTVDG